MRRKFFRNIFKDLGIDLGTANSVIYLKRSGIVINEPTYAAVNTKTNRIMAVGEEAKKMINRSPAYINVVRPLVGGVISDFDMTEELLRQFLKKISSNLLFGYRRAILAIPSNLTEVERKSIEDAVLGVGCSRVYLVESTLAAALGTHLPINVPLATLIADIGGGTTDISVISLEGSVVSKTLKTAGDKMNVDIINFIREEFNLVIGEPTAELVKITVGSAMPIDERLEMPVRGRDLTTGLPKEVLIKNTQIRTALSRSLRDIVEGIKEVISLTPPELVGDILKQGIYLCGGGALIRGIDKLIEKETSVSTYIAENPLIAVASGLGRIVEEFEKYEHMLENPLSPKLIKL